MKEFFVLLVFALCLVACEKAFSQTPPTVEYCDAKKPFKIKITSEGRALDAEGTLGLRIALKPLRFNRQEMISVARYISMKYCNEKSIVVAFFDSAADARNTRAVLDHLLERPSQATVRGFLTIDRKRKVRILRFSTQRGKSTSEVSIDLLTLMPV